MILWKKHSIEAISDDGVLLKGMIVYWSKEYSVELMEPIWVKKYGSHMMYMIPQAFIVDENTKNRFMDKNGIRYTNIFGGCIETLKELYEENK